MFEEMISAIQSETVRRLYSVRIKKDQEIKRERVASRPPVRASAATAP